MISGLSQVIHMPKTDSVLVIVTKLKNFEVPNILKWQISTIEN